MHARLVLFAVVWLIHVHPTMGQVDVDPLIQEVEAVRPSMISQLPGLRLEYTLQAIKDGSEIARTEFTSSRISKRRWRVNSKSDTPSLFARTIARNGRLGFVALNQGDGYKYEIVGFGSVMNRVIDSKASSFYKPLNRISTIGRVDVGEFLKTPGLEILERSPVSSSTGRPAEKLTWKNDRVTPGKIQFGEAVWLPEDGFLIESWKFWFGEDKTGLQTCVNSFDEYDGELVLLSSKFSVGSIDYLLARRDVGPPVDDPEYYKPEALGLKSPPDPIWKSIAWFAIGIVLFVCGFYFYRRMSPK